MKTIQFLSVLFLSLFLSTQPGFSQVEKGMLLHGKFEGEEKYYVAEITAVNGEDFTCRFLHSNSIYTMHSVPTTGDLSVSTTRLMARVKQTAGGKFKANTLFTYLAVKPKAGDCKFGEGPGYWDNLVIVKFSDGKSYLGEASKEGDHYDILFLHTKSVYQFSLDGTVLKSNGGYGKGSKASIRCADPLYYN